MFSLLKRAQRYPRYLMLKELLDAHSDRLAESLDCQRSTGQEQRSLANYNAQSQPIPARSTCTDATEIEHVMQ
ncbi:hypothetical protein [Streptomyces sp. TRM49041]|uniref:hypothetical protein n=1 Tax=Streptomyces sp. TRM49041 TaxID=2603216 RepID=UPI0011EFC34C|nr:hypothetical protein [Streptomyces sp. TRM49041]